MTSKVNRDNYILIQGFMVTELGLKGNELLVYACIYGFSQAENQTFNGGLQYLADWTNSTKQGVIKCLKSLVEKGLIEKKETVIQGVKFCEYYVTKFNGVLNKVEYPIKQSLTGGINQSLPNNKDINNISNIKNNKKVSSFDSIVSAYAGNDGELLDLLGEWLKVRKAKRAAMTDRAVQMNIDKLDDMAAQSGMSVKEYLKEIICRGWAAFYAISNYSYKGQTPQTASTESHKQLDAYMQKYAAPAGGTVYVEDDESFYEGL